MSVKNAHYGENGLVSFAKLWEVMEDRGIKQQYLINNGIHRATIYKIKSNENITCEVIANLCRLLDCQPGDIMEYIPNGKAEQTAKKTPRIISSAEEFDKIYGD